MKYLKNSILIIVFAAFLIAANRKIIDFYYLYRKTNAFTQEHILGKLDYKIKIWISEITTDVPIEDATNMYNLAKKYVDEDIEFFYCKNDSTSEEICSTLHEKDSWYTLTDEEKRALFMAVIRLQIRVGGLDSELLPFSYKGCFGRSEQFLFPAVRRKALFRKNGKIFFSFYFDYWNSKSNNEYIINNAVKFFEFEDEVQVDYSLQRILTKDWKSYYSYELKKLVRDFVDKRKLESEK